MREENSSFYLPLQYQCDSLINYYFYSKVEVDEMKQLIMGAAPNLDTPHLLKILAWVFETTPDNVPSAEAAELSKAIERLQNCHVPRS